MLNGKFIGIDRVIEGVYRDFGWSDQLDWIDAVEWTGEIMDMIAAPMDRRNHGYDCCS
jgi:hypothetical protein